MRVSPFWSLAFYEGSYLISSELDGAIGSVHTERVSHVIGGWIHCYRVDRMSHSSGCVEGHLHQRICFFVVRAADLSPARRKCEHSEGSTEEQQSLTLQHYLASSQVVPVPESTSSGGFIS